MAGNPPRTQLFYRRWSSRAAEIALHTGNDDKMQARCAHSATMWSQIADAIEAGDNDRFRLLTTNLACLAPEDLPGWG
ncbi:MAG TPA: hypothetical protein VF503_19040 [Sphingobium sp.]|uniref:hypothetical protein n=1 Tax=Sphingobium sp. TaxID=1912891 RepID=UPI002ED3EA4C